MHETVLSVLLNISGSHFDYSLYWNESTPPPPPPTNKHYILALEKKKYNDIKI